MPFLRRVLHVPDTWEAWAIRILTIFLAIVLVAEYHLLGQLADLEDFVSESRQQRTQFQSEEKARQCRILEIIGVTETERAELKC